MARWDEVRKVLKALKVLESDHVARNDLAAVVPGAADPRHKWGNAMKRGGDAAVPTTRVKGVVAVHGSKILDSLSRLLGSDFGAFVLECEDDARALLARFGAPTEPLDAAIEAARQAERQAARQAAVVEEEVVPYCYEDGRLYLNGEVVPMLFFKDKPSEPWFKAKPIHNFLGALNIGQTMARVHDDDKGKLETLMSQKGTPNEFQGVMSDISSCNSLEGSRNAQSSSVRPTDQNELGAWYVNESGLYCIIMGSEKEIAKPFQRWVTSEVLPSIRRTGRYDMSGEPEPKRARQQDADALAIPVQFETQVRRIAERTLETWTSSTMTTTLVSTLSQVVASALATHLGAQSQRLDTLQLALASQSQVIIESSQVSLQTTAQAFRDAEASQARRLESLQLALASQSQVSLQTTAQALRDAEASQARRLDALQLAVLRSQAEHAEIIRSDVDRARASVSSSVSDVLASLQGVARSFANTFNENIAGRMTLVSLQMMRSIRDSVREAFGAQAARARRQPTRGSVSERDLPEAQMASPEEAGPRSVALSSVALKRVPNLCFLAWRRVRAPFAKAVLREKLRRHGLGPEHEDYVARPRLWAYAGPVVEGGGARFVHLDDQVDLIVEVWTRLAPTTPAQRRAGAPVLESLELRAARLMEQMSAAERGVRWPTHRSEYEPPWQEAL
jgi:prophage antirepressor-like protein